MQITITGKHIDVTDALKDYANERLSKLKKYIDKATITLVLTVEKHRHISEVTINYSGGSSHFSAETKDLYSAIDKMMDKVEKQFRKVKEKNADHKGEKVAAAFEEPEDEFE